MEEEEEGRVEALLEEEEDQECLVDLPTTT